MSTPILKSFTFVPQPKPSSDPLIIKRERMIARLEDQKKLFADPGFVRTVKRWERKEGGEKVLVEKPLRTSKWWQPDQNGGYVMTVKIGSKRIEFEKGKATFFRESGTGTSAERRGSLNTRRLIESPE